MNEKKKILLATTNPGKVAEIDPLLAALNIDLVSLKDLDVDSEFEESGETFDENARQKALHFHNLSGHITIADDSGLVIDALDGGPGVKSARYLGYDTSHSEKMRRILIRMENVSELERSAHFACSLALAMDGDVLSVVTKRVFGRISTEPRGSNGFGYDPIFFYPAIKCTFGQADSELKEKLSHRGQAVRALIKLFETLPQLRQTFNIKASL